MTQKVELVHNEHSPIHSAVTDEMLQRSEYILKYELSEEEKDLSNQLNNKQIKFVKLVVAGYPRYKAYNMAYDQKQKTISSMFYASKDRPKIERLIELLLEKTLLAGLMVKEEKRNILAQIARDPKNTPLERIAAVRVDNKMAGHECDINVNYNLQFDKLYEKIKPTLGLPSKEEIKRIENAEEE